MDCCRLLSRFARRWKYLREFLPRGNASLRTDPRNVRFLSRWICLGPSRLEFALACLLPEVRKLLGPSLIRVAQTGRISSVPVWIFRRGLNRDLEFVRSVAFCTNLTASQIRSLTDWVCRVAVMFALGREERLPRGSETVQDYRTMAAIVLVNAAANDWRASPKNAALLRRVLRRRHETSQPLLIAGLQLRVFSGQEIQRYYRQIHNIAHEGFGRWRLILDRVAEHPEVPTEFLVSRLLESQPTRWQLESFTIREDVRRNPHVRSELLRRARMGDIDFFLLLCKEASREELPKLMEELVERWPGGAHFLLENPSEWPRNLTAEALVPALTSAHRVLRLAALRVLAHVNSVAS